MKSRDSAIKSTVNAMSELDTRKGSDVVYDDRIVRQFFLATLFWCVIAVGLGILVSGLMLMPELSTNVEGLTVGRLRPIHTNAALFAFVGNAMFAAVYFSTQRLCRARMWSGILSQLHFWSWQLIILAGLFSLMLGATQSKAYSEFEWPIDIAIALSWIMFFGVNFFATLLVRRERYMYISLWFYLATIIVFALLHMASNIVHPMTMSGTIGSATYFAGVPAVMLNWWYSQESVLFFTIMPFLGMMYYFLPRAGGGPIYSYRLAVIQFWSLIVLFAWTFARDLQYTAVPEWSMGLATVFTILLVMPLWAGVLNARTTFAANWNDQTHRPVLRFFVAAIGFYAWIVIDSTLMGFGGFNAILNYSSWNVAHTHALMVGWDGMLLFGALYWMAPIVFNSKHEHAGAASIAFWAILSASLLLIIPGYIAGFTEGWMWSELDENAQLQYTFIQTLNAVQLYRWIGLVAGGLYLLAVLLIASDLARVWAAGQSATKTVPISGDRFDRSVVEPASMPSQLDVVLEMAKKLDVWSRLEWHRIWERKPFRMASVIAGAFVFVSSIMLLPTLFVSGNTQAIRTIEPFTPLELIGRDLFVREGCSNCHTQIVRALIPETKRYGTFTRAEESKYDAPVLWGKRRIGPDLAREGGKQSNLWHYDHLADPRSQVAGSIMPAFPQLVQREIDFDQAIELVHAAQISGAVYPFADEQAGEKAAEQALEVAAVLVQQGGPVRTQNQSIVALIAYLQRLGVDLNRPQTADKE